MKETHLMRRFLSQSWVAIWLFAVLAGGSVSAQMMPGAPDLVPIGEPDVVCVRPGGMFAISFNPPRIWQGDEGEEDGLELKVDAFAKARCGEDLHMVAHLEFYKQRLNYFMEMDREAGTGELELKVTISSPQSDNGPETLEFTCRYEKQHTIVPCAHK